MRSRLALLAAGAAGILAAALLLGALTAQPAFARADLRRAACAKTYRVQRGDWLEDIARRKHTTVAKLVRLNPWLKGREHLIYAGQLLCLQAAPPRTQPPTEPPAVTTEEPSPGPSDFSQVAIEVIYTYLTPTEENVGTFAPGGRLGRRVLYPIEPAEDAIGSYGTSDEIEAIVRSGSAPMLVGVRGIDDTAYTLVAVGDISLLTPLLITDTKSVQITSCIPVPVRETLGGSEVKDVRVTLWMEAPIGVSYPFTVTQVDQVDSGRLAVDCYGAEDKEFGFVILPATSGSTGHYRVAMMLTDGQLGPPGSGWRQRCKAWRQSRGWFYRWLVSWYGCR